MPPLDDGLKSTNSGAPAGRWTSPSPISCLMASVFSTWNIILRKVICFWCAHGCMWLCVHVCAGTYVHAGSQAHTYMYASRPKVNLRCSSSEVTRCISQSRVPHQLVACQADWIGCSVSTRGISLYLPLWSAFFKQGFWGLNPRSLGSKLFTNWVY